MEVRGLLYSSGMHVLNENKLTIQHDLVSSDYSLQVGFNLLGLNLYIMAMAHAW